MGVLDELGLAEADLSALARDMPERPKELRRPTARTPASEERERAAARARAERRVRLIEGFDDGETLDDLARRLDLDARLVEDVHDRLSKDRALTPEQEHALGARPRRRATTCAELGLSRPLAADGEEFTELMEELRLGLRGDLA
jgi:hypothetical protein